jgi:DNA-binding transcriptional MerR regulator
MTTPTEATNTSYIPVSYDGDRPPIQIPVAIANNDESLKSTLSAYGIASARTAKVQRNEDGTITLIKQAGQNGASLAAIRQILEDAPAHQNPAIALYLQLQYQDWQNALTPEYLLMMQETIRQTMHEGEIEQQSIQSALSQLSRRRPLPMSKPFACF